MVHDLRALLRLGEGRDKEPTAAILDRAAHCALHPRVGIEPATMGLEAVMNSIRNSLGMRETEIAREPSRLWNPHFYANFAQVHNTL
jgi:hypothetical protein